MPTHGTRSIPESDSFEIIHLNSRFRSEFPLYPKEQIE